MEPKTLTPEQLEALKPIDLRLTELCLFLWDYQQRFGALPELERSTRVEDQTVYVKVGSVPTRMFRQEN